jgi:hypothetical protein
MTVSQKVKGLLKKTHLFKYTETKLMSLLNVIPLDFNAPVPAFHKFFFNSVRKKVYWLRLQQILHCTKS